MGPTGEVVQSRHPASNSIETHTAELQDNAEGSIATPHHLRALAGRDGATVQQIALSLQQAAGNAAMRKLIADGSIPPSPVAMRSMVAQRQVATYGKHQFTFPDAELGQKTLSYAKVSLAAGGVIEYEVTPSTGAAGSTPGTEVSGVGSNQTPEGGGGTKASGGVSASGETAAYQVEVSHEFKKRTEGWFTGWTPKAKIGGEAGA